MKFKPNINWAWRHLVLFIFEIIPVDARGIVVLLLIEVDDVEGGHTMGEQ